MSTNNYSDGLATDMWYAEIDEYDYNEPGFSSGTQHLTQLLWKNTRKVGFGYASSLQWTYIVAVYYPSGNQRR